jgi:hypothetical protein
MAYNILHLIGQESIKKSDAPLRKKVERRRIRTVIQNLIYLASRLVYHARKYKLGFGQHHPSFLLLGGFMVLLPKLQSVLLQR